MNHPTTSSPGTQSRELACVIDGCERPRYTSERLCAHHRGWLRRALLYIPKHALMVTAMLGHTTTSGGDKVSGSKERPLPAAAVLALTGPQAEGSHSSAPEDEAAPTVLSVVGSWALFVEDELELRHQTYPTSLAGLRLACETLIRTGAFEFLCSHDLAASAHDEITSVWKRVRRAARDDPQPQRGMVPCPNPQCNLRTLISPEPGEPYVCARHLDGCGLIVTEAEYDELAAHLGGVMIDHDERHHLDAQHEQVAEALHWRPTERGEFEPRHVPGRGPDDRSLLRGFGTAHDVEEVA